MKEGRGSAHSAGRSAARRLVRRGGPSGQAVNVWRLLRRMPMRHDQPAPQHRHPLPRRPCRRRRSGPCRQPEHDSLAGIDPTDQRLTSSVGSRLRRPPIALHRLRRFVSDPPKAAAERPPALAPSDSPNAKRTTAATTETSASSRAAIERLAGLKSRPTGGAGAPRRCVPQGPKGRSAAGSRGVQKRSGIVCGRSSGWPHTLVAG